MGRPMRITVDYSLPDLTPTEIAAAIKRGQRGLKNPHTAAKAVLGATEIVIRPQVAAILAGCGLTEDTIFEGLIRAIGRPEYAK